MPDERNRQRPRQIKFYVTDDELEEIKKNQAKIWDGINKIIESLALLD